MNSLIERLREDEWGPYATLRREAADETERLQFIIAVYEKSFQGEIYAENKALQARVEVLEGAARKTLREQDMADEHHSVACMNWALLEHSQHQCGMCDLREAIAATEQKGE